MKRLRSFPGPECAPVRRPAGERVRADILRSSLPSVEDVERLAGIFRLMADPGRARILATLLEAGEDCVHDLAAVSGSSESSVSQALRLMRRSASW